MTPISQHMTRQPITIDRHASLARAHRLMQENGIHHLPVVESGRVVGIVHLCELGLLEAVAPFRFDAVDTEDAMSEAFTVVADAPVDVVIESMARGGFAGAAIVDDESRLVGIFTTADALQLLLDRLHN
ncbi:MAG: HPP family protein [Kofleriaceae bacterium]